MFKLNKIINKSVILKMKFKLKIKLYLKQKKNKKIKNNFMQIIMLKLIFKCFKPF